LYMGHFFETDPQPKSFAPNPDQPTEVITWPNPTHRRHSSV